MTRPKGTRVKVVEREIDNIQWELKRIEVKFNSCKVCSILHNGCSASSLRPCPAEHWTEVENVRYYE